MTCGKKIKVMCVMLNLIYHSVFAMCISHSTMHGGIDHLSRNLT